MAEIRKELNARLSLKYDLYSNWNTNNPVLLKGEVAFAYVPADATLSESGANVAGTTPPNVLIKVGDGVNHYNDLKFTSAMAADVHGWAKADVKPEYQATEIKGLEEFISGEIQDTDTQYTLVKVNDYQYKLMSKALDETEFTTEVGILDIPKYDDTTLAGRVTETEEAIAILNGTASEAGSVAKAIADAIAALNLAETYATKEHKHVASDITDLDDTITAYDFATKADAKAYADSKDEAIAAAKKAGDDAKAYVDSEDIFEIDMLTVNAHGGVAANEDLNGLTTHEILKKILYPYVQPSVGNATATPNGGTYEKGVTKTISQVSISVTKKSEAITSVALYNGATLIEEKTGDAVKNGGTITFSNLSVEVPTDGNQLTVKVTDAKGTVQEKKTASMTFVYPYYMGSCAAGTTIDESLVISLSKTIESKGNKANSFTVSDGHMVFAYPKSYGSLKSILDPNNFETIGNYTCHEVNVTGLDGTSQTYYVYVSGATTVSAFVVNFKY